MKQVKLKRNYCWNIFDWTVIETELKKNLRRSYAKPYFS